MSKVFENEICIDVDSLKPDLINAKMDQFVHPSELSKDASEERSFLGIDLGTSCISAAIWKETGIQYLGMGKRSGEDCLFSTLYVSEDGEILDGRMDVKSATEASQSGLSLSLTLLLSILDGIVKKMPIDYASIEVIKDTEEGEEAIRIGQYQHSIASLFALFFRRIRAMAEEECTTYTFDKAVMAIPACFGAPQRKVLQAAGHLAGLTFDFIEGATAFGMLYQRELQNLQEHTIAIYDFGAGCFHCSFIKVSHSELRLLSSSGESFIGGHEVNRLIVNYWMSINNIDPNRLNTEIRLAEQLYHLAEKAKLALNQSDSFKEILDGKFNCQISIETFHKLLQPILNLTLDHCHHARIAASVSKLELDEIIMIGGSSRISLVEKVLTQYFAKKPRTYENPEKVVLEGAVLKAISLYSDSKA